MYMYVCMYMYIYAKQNSLRAVKKGRSQVK